MNLSAESQVLLLWLPGLCLVHIASRFTSDPSRDGRHRAFAARRMLCSVCFVTIPLMILCQYHLRLHDRSWVLVAALQVADQQILEINSNAERLEAQSALMRQQGQTQAASDKSAEAQKCRDAAAQVLSVAIENAQMLAYRTTIACTRNKRLFDISQVVGHVNAGGGKAIHDIA